jgi:hypothetical protein
MKIPVKPDTLSLGAIRAKKGGMMHVMSEIFIGPFCLPDPDIDLL